MIKDDKITMSSLCRTITRDGKTVQVDIYTDNAIDWTLEVVDEFNNSTVWDDPFDSDQNALNEALDTIEKEGIHALIGPEPDTDK